MQLTPFKTTVPITNPSCPKPPKWLIKCQHWKCSVKKLLQFHILLLTFYGLFDPLTQGDDRVLDFKGEFCSNQCYGWCVCILLFQHLSISKCAYKVFVFKSHSTFHPHNKLCEYPCFICVTLSIYTLLSSLAWCSWDTLSVRGSCCMWHLHAWF